MAGLDGIAGPFLLDGVQHWGSSCARSDAAGAVLPAGKQPCLTVPVTCIMRLVASGSCDRVVQPGAFGCTLSTTWSTPEGRGVGEEGLKLALSLIPLFQQH